MRWFLAPLAGFTDAPFRRLCFEGGADVCYTEMVSAAGLAHGSSPTRHLMETMEGEGPVACQLFGANQEELAYATRVASAFAGFGGKRFCEINLNAGCPMTKVTRCGAGAKLVEDPAKIGRLLKAMVANTDLPVTLKTRLGPHPGRTTVFDILAAAEDAGAKGVTVHARYTSQMHGGPVHLDTLAEVVARAHVPVCGNGSVTDAKTAAAMAATGVSAIMVGRAALAEPGVFARLKAEAGDNKPTTTSGGVDDKPTTTSGGVDNKPTTKSGGVDDKPTTTSGDGACCRGLVVSDGPATAARHLEYLLAFREQLAAKYPNDHIPGPDGYASVKMHVHLFRYFNGRPGAAALRARLNAVRTLDEIREILSLS